MYDPKTVQNIIVTLDATTEELGTYSYMLKLIAHPPTPEPALYFKTALGEVTKCRAFLKNTVDERVDFGVIV